MIVISDTGPLRYLAVLGHAELLPQLFAQILCPSDIISECQHPKAPDALRALITAQPEWLVIRDPQNVGPELACQLDKGEAAAISLAQEVGADFVVAGTLKILALAAQRGLLDYHATVSELRTTTNFRVSDAVVKAASFEP
jgi:predicted nucleic acid-binding protein